MEHGGSLRRTHQMPGASLHASIPIFSAKIPSWCHQSALDPVKVAEPVQIRPREPFHSPCINRPVAQDVRASAFEAEGQGANPCGPAFQFSMDVEPDKRAGAVSKTECASRRQGEHALRLPPFFNHASVAQQTERRASNAEVAGASPAGSAITFVPSLCSPIAEATASKAVPCRCESGHRDQPFIPL